jgi:hypothetical protein
MSKQEMHIVLKYLCFRDFWYHLHDSGHIHRTVPGGLLPPATATNTEVALATFCWFYQHVPQLISNF